MTKNDDRVLDSTRDIDDQVSDWTKGLPSNEELTPLSHALVPGILASAFRIKHDEPMTAEDVRRESQATVRNLFNLKPTPSFDAFPAFREKDEAGKLPQLLLFETDSFLTCSCKLFGYVIVIHRMFF